MPRKPAYVKGLIFLLLVIYCLYLHLARQPCENLHVYTNSVQSPDENNWESLLERAQLVDVTCVVNREVGLNVGLPAAARQFSCKHDVGSAEVYVPFSFLRQYYETQGSWGTKPDTGTKSDAAQPPPQPPPPHDTPGEKGQKPGGKGEEEVTVDKNFAKEFEISLSDSKVYSPTAPYNPFGTFLHFHSFEVEGRSRVKAVSAQDNVPVSKQWNPDGYYYPTQIAQFSLSHYSTYVKGHQEGVRRVEVVGEGSALPTHAARVREDQGGGGDAGGGGENSFVIEYNNSVEFHISSPHHLLCLELWSLGSGADGAGFHLSVDYEGKEYTIVYSHAEKFIQAKGREIIYGFGREADGKWLKLTRDIATDLKKGLALLKKKKVRRSKVQLKRVTFTGRGRVRNLTLSNQEHLRIFYHGADWFLKYQDKNGGWPSLVVFNEGRKKYPQAKEIPAGWYGAMCQGQAISVLCRAYHASNNTKYLRAAHKAIGVFSRPSEEGGVRAEFMGRYPWYEEYPTSPPTFILNGFMYSLLGLYDLSVADPESKLARDLFNRGLESLNALLPFYDSGSATFYDLRHFTMKTSPKLARWDYHSTHINQLLALATIRNGTQLKETAERWRGYMVGKRAPHN